MGRPKPKRELIEDVLDAGRELGAAAVFFHSAVADQFGFGATDTKTLDLLQHSGPLTPKELSELTGLAPASITGIIDRLERKGFVRRVPHPEDGRRLLVEFDPSANARMVPLYDGLSRSLTEMLQGYTADQLELLAGAFRESARRQQQAALEVTTQA